MSENTPGFDTLAIHAGAKPDPTTGARATPIYQTTSFVFDDVDHAASLFGLQAFGNIYTRITNPTTAVLEERVATLEGGTAALAVASGHAAQLLTFHALMTPGCNIVASKRMYGGTINQLNHSFKSFGWDVKWAEGLDGQSFADQIDENTRAVFIESVANRVAWSWTLRHLSRCQRSWRPADRRQHHGNAISLPANQARRRHRAPLPDQVYGRSWQLHGRCNC